MIAQNPKKEVTVNYSIEDVKAAILKMQKKDVILLTNDAVMNEIVLHEKDIMSSGYHVSYILTKKSDSETLITI